MNYFSVKNKEVKLTLLISIGLSIIYFFYDIPWGLMDDYRWIILTLDFIKDPYLHYLEFQNDRITGGMLQPLIQLQFILQYLPGIYLGPLFTHIQNIFLLFFIHLFLFSFFKDKLKIDYIHSLSIFLIYPYTFDMFLLPSLQEKFTVPIFVWLLFLLEKSKNNKKNYTVLIFVLSLVIPLIKLQGAIFVWFIFFYYLLYKSKESLISLFGFIFSISLQAYILFFVESGYYAVNNSINKMVGNLFSVQNLFFLFVIFFALFITFFEKDKKIKYYIYGLSLSGLSLIFIFINWETYGYLMSFYAFFISLLLPYCIYKILNFLKITKFSILITILLIILSILSSYLFFVPRMERWSDVGNVYSLMDEVKFDENIYYCGSEGVLTFNNLNNNLNEVKFAGNFEDINEQIFYFIKDDLQCTYLEDILNSACDSSNKNISRYRRVEIIKYSC